MPTAAIYARVSSDKQRDEQTIVSQLAAVKELAANMALEIPPEWVFADEAYSGSTLVRPGLECLRDLVAQGLVEMVLCYAPDRLARRYAYQVLLLEEFARGGAEVRFVRGRKAETPEDELLLQFQGMIAEYEKAQIIERTRRGKLHRARAGTVNVMSAAPYGYRYVRKTPATDARFDVVEEQASVVRSLFNRYITERVAIGTLAKWLTSQAIPTATGKRIWDRSVVWAILRNPAYCGRAAFGKTARIDTPPRLNRVGRVRGYRVPRRPAHRERPQEEWLPISVPAIISEQTFELARRRLQDNARFATRHTKEPSLLQGLLVCESCGYAYYRTSTRTKRRKLYYYRCLGSDDYRYEHGRICHNLPVRQDYLDAVVWEHVGRLLADPTLIRHELDRRLAELRTTDPDAAHKSRLERELTRVGAARNRLIAAYQEELLSLDELRQQMPALRTKESNVHLQLEAIAARLADQASYLKLAEGLESFVARLQHATQTASIPDRQQVLRLVVREVLVGPERIRIRHSLPVSATDPPPGYLLRGGRHTAPLRHSLLALCPCPFFQHAGPQPLCRGPDYADLRRCWS